MYMTTRYAMICVLVAITSRAQVTTATLYGIVTDSTGAAVPGATAALTNQDTGSSMAKTTDSAGEFIFDFVHVGKYTLRIEAKRFKALVTSGLDLVSG